MLRRELASVQPVSEECLRMQGIDHVDAFPEVVEREEHDVAGARIDLHEIQHVRQSHAGPLGDERPAFFAGLVGDLRVRGILLQIRERERCGARDHAVDAQPPVREAANQQAVVRIDLGRRAIDRNRARDVVAAELASESMLADEQTLRCIRQRLPDAVQTAGVGRYETAATRDADSCSACHRSETASDHRSPRDDPAHNDSTSRPEIISRMRARMPPLNASATCPSTKITISAATKKWIVRADCCPPNMLTITGATDASAGENAR